MADNKLKKIIDLINKTGDRAIIVNENVEPQFVIMGVADYENLLIKRDRSSNLTEEQILSKINRDVAIWRTDQSENEFIGNIEPVNEVNQNIINQAEVIKKEIIRKRELEELKKEIDRKEIEKREIEEDEYYFEPAEEEEELKS